MLFVLLMISACLGDPVGPGSLVVVAIGGSLDTMWVGAPGEPIAGGVRVLVTDDAGRPLPAASLTWEATGHNAQVLTPASQSDASGYATAVWQLGTNAAEPQALHVLVRTQHHVRDLRIAARAVPHIVSQLRAVVDTPAVMRLGDTLSFRAIAIDPYGNEFPAPDLTLSVADSTIAFVAPNGSIESQQRGRTNVNVTSQGVSADVPLNIVQHVAEIRPASDTIRLRSLGAELDISYEVLDDRGQAVLDTSAAIAVMDTSIASVVEGRVRAVLPGVTGLRLAIGSVEAGLTVAVEQRIASLEFQRDTIRFDALLDTTTIHPIAQDSLGSQIAHPEVVLQIGDHEVVRASGRTLEAVRPGVTTAVIVDPVTGIAASVPVVVAQRIAAIEVAAVTFDALGDTIPIAAIARDRLGSAVANPALEYVVDDPSVVAVDQNSLHSLRGGRVSLTARDPETGVTGQVVVVVDQVAVSLSARVDFPSEVITLPAGSSFPLRCEAKDRNGFAIDRDAALVGSMKGTVSGSGCADARVERSGYDTVSVEMNGIQARLSVIVATRPDSVAVLAAAWPLATDDRIRFVAENLANPSILALRPLVADILADYGNPTSNLDRARAIRDWVARTAIYPDSWVRPNATTSNLSVLPPGKTWADVNRLLTAQRWNEDAAFWGQFYSDGYVMLDRLLGTLDPVTGQRADDGMMEHVAGARYRMRDVTSYRYVACTFQVYFLNTLWAAAGLHGLQVSILNHDPAAVFIPEMGRWVYQDPTYNEEYLLDGVGEPLSPLDLLTLSTAGQSGRLRPARISGPSFDPEPYLTLRKYMDAGHPEGMIIMGAAMTSRWVGAVGVWNPRRVQVQVPALDTVPAPWGDPSWYRPVTADQAFPKLGPTIVEVQSRDSVEVIQLASTFPDHQRFERRREGRDWEQVGETDVLPVGSCRVEYRSIDSVGSVSATAVLEVWLPRAADFISSAIPGSTRAEGESC